MRQKANPARGLQFVCNRAFFMDKTTRKISIVKEDGYL
jgi:hypothetical protein